MKKILFFYLALFLLLATTACEKVRENPLTDLKKGIWRPVESAPKKFPYRFLDAPDTIAYHTTPFWMIGEDKETLATQNIIRINHEVHLNDNNEWQVRYRHRYNLWTMKVNATKDTLTFFYKDENNEEKTIDYVYLLEQSNTPTKSLLDLTKRLEGLVYKVNLEKEYFIPFRKASMISDSNSCSMYTDLVYRDTNSWMRGRHYYIDFYKSDAFIFIKPSLSF